MPVQQNAKGTESIGEVEHGRRVAQAELTETTPSAGAALHWALASPLLLFVTWFWVDFFTYYSPVQGYALDVLLSIGALLLLIVLPLGALAHRLVTSLPGLFHHAGWDVQPLEAVAREEQYTVRYAYRRRNRAESAWRRWWMRAAQGWVYLEIGVIFAGALLMIPMFLSASRFGFGR